jgi:hypothetical protein
MFRGEIGNDSGPPCRVRKMRQWVPLMLVVVVGLAVAHVAGLTKPLATLAAQLCRSYSRDLSTPAGRLVGDWESDNDPLFRRVSYPAPKGPKRGTGVYRADTGSGTRDVVYGIVSQDEAGTNLEMQEYLPGTDLNGRVWYTMAEDGQSMTRRYDARNGGHVTCHYRYVGRPTNLPD